LGIAMTKPLLVSEQNPLSRRCAVLADEGTSIWLYLTEPNDERPVADCWLLNTVPAPIDLSSYRAVKGAPPATRQYAGANSEAQAPEANAVRFQWSVDGESVAALVSSELLGFIAAGRKRGFSKHLLAEGPFGLPLDEQLYTRLFTR